MDNNAAMKFFKPLQEYWEKQDKKRKILHFVIGGAALALIIIIVLLLNHTEYAVLYNGLSSEEAGQIMTRLNELEVDAKAKGAGTILVPKGKEDELHMQLASEGYPQSGLNYDMFEKSTGFGTTDYEKQKYMQFQIQERLQGAIKSLDNVDDAIVTLYIPETSSFVLKSDKESASASVILRIKRGMVPRFAKPGTPGEEWEISLELKLLADVGLVGYPSVGKSSLISVVSQAKPKIGDYHFTTIVPNLGVVNMGEGSSFVIADIPGLIEGASDGVGLGHQFLRHIERCRMLIHIVDVSASEGRNPIDDFEKINEELVKFNPELAKRPMIVTGNKIDMAEPEQIEEFKKYVNDKGYEYYSICAPICEGTKELMNITWNKLKDLPPIREYETEEVPLEALIPDDNSFKITQVDEGYYLVEAKWFPKVLKGIDVTDYEALQYMQRVLEKSGIFGALKEKGIQEGDIVSLYDIEFEYIP